MRNVFNLKIFIRLQFIKLSIYRNKLTTTQIELGSRYRSVCRVHNVFLNKGINKILNLYTAVKYA